MVGWPVARVVVLAMDQVLSEDGARSREQYVPCDGRVLLPALCSRVFNLSLSRRPVDPRVARLRSGAGRCVAEDLFAVEAPVLDEDLRDLASGGDAAREVHTPHARFQASRVERGPSGGGVEADPDSREEVEVRVEAGQRVHPIGGEILDGAVGAAD